MMEFVHLHCRSAYSLSEGTALPQTLVAAARRGGMPALAMTDRNNLYGAVPFYLHALKSGIKPVIGMEVDLDEWSGAQSSRLVLLARNMDGYRNLCRLSSMMLLSADPSTFRPAGFDAGEDGEEEIAPWDEGVWGVSVFGSQLRLPTPQRGKAPQLPKETLLSGRYARGLVALSGGRGGLVNSLVARGNIEGAAKAAGMLVAAFGEGNFFIELTLLDDADRESLPRLAQLADRLGIPIVASNDVLYLEPEDVHTATLLNSQHSPPNTHPPILSTQHSALSTHQHFKSVEEMRDLFREYPQAIANTRYIADQCSVELPVGRPLFPSIELPGGETPFSRVWKLCFAGATRLYRPLAPAVISQLKHEMEIIEALGFCEYFLVVHDIVHFAHSQGIPLMARGSAANSLVAYVLGITQVDPLAHGLLFERFLNPSRAEFEMPDIDLDLCWRRRDEVLHYIYERHGRDHVATIGTYITFKSRSARRFLARTERLRPIPAEELESDDPSTPDSSLTTQSSVLSPQSSLIGLPQHLGMHCGGVVITPGPITDLVPLQRASRDHSMAITQYDKNAIESLGLVKIDLLGSRALTTLVDAVKSARLDAGHATMRDVLDALPADDPATYRIMADGNTLGCFQLESPGMRGLLKWLRPRSMESIAAAISLFRPGPLQGGFLETFMRRHLGLEPLSYFHPSMEPILRDTYGVILYQEQFLRLVNELAGVSLGDAEKLRKALGKTRDAGERIDLGKEFVAGAIERGIPQLQAEKVWEIVSGYTGFGFCKAHACSYAPTAYRSAYMKTHYPSHYMAAMLNNGGGYYGPTVYVEDARRFGVELLPPHVNRSGAMCSVPPGPGGGRTIRIGLQFVRGLSEPSIAAICAERIGGGLFFSLPDLLSRVSLRPREAEMLVKAGACDDLSAPGEWVAEAESEDDAPHPKPPLNRGQLLWLLPHLLAVRLPTARQTRRSKDADTRPSMQLLVGGLLPLLHGDGGEAAPKILGLNRSLIPPVPPLDDLTPAQKLTLEREALGFTVSRNESELWARVLSERGVISSADLPRHAEREVSVAGVAVAGRNHTCQNGDRMLFLTLQDASGLVETVLFPDTYKAHSGMIDAGGRGPYIIRGTVQVSGKGRGIGVQPPADLAQIIANLRQSDALAMKMHPVVIVSGVELLQTESEKAPEQVLAS